MKTQKGITLVALIITIVVLLVLAVVSINSIQNEGIMLQAQNAADTWNESQSNEQGTLGGYETILNQYNPNGSNVKKISFTIYITEDTTFYAEEGMTWAEWVESEYNVDNQFIVVETRIKNADNTKRIFCNYTAVTPTQTILDGEHYVLAKSSPVPY